MKLFNRNKSDGAPSFAPGDWTPPNISEPPKPASNIFGRKPKKGRVNSNKMSTPTQTQAKKAARLRNTVFAGALVVIGLLGLLITSSSGKVANYTVYESQTYIAPGTHIRADELLPVVVHSPVPSSATRAQILSSVPITGIYNGEIIEKQTLAPSAAVPANTVLEGVSLSSNHAPNSPLFVGEKVDVYYSSSSSSNQNNATGIVNLSPGQLITTATVVSTIPTTSSSNGVDADIAVPAKSAGIVAMALANTDVTIGVI